MHQASRLLIVLAALSVLLGTDCAHAHTHHSHTVTKAATKTAASLAITVKPPNDAPDFDYAARIQQAQALVASQPIEDTDMVVNEAGNLSRFTWVLAVGKKTGPLTIVRMDQHGNNDQGLKITWPVDNFINTKFQVEGPNGLMVFAQRRPVRAPDGKGWEEAVYTAYAPQFDTKQMRDAGMEYLRHLQRQAYEQIKSHDVRSHVTPNATVAERIPSDMVLRLMITEHVDPAHMKFVGIEQCVHEVLVTLAANQGKAYAYARSRAGALGLPQFMEGSYQMVRANYPKASLEEDFDDGMTNMRNAVLATVLLLDLELTQMPRATLQTVTRSRSQFDAFLAAGYNRNPAHVMQTYRRTKSFTGGSAPFENKMYVRIQSWVGNFLKKEYAIPARG